MDIIKNQPLHFKTNKTQRITVIGIFSTLCVVTIILCLKFNAPILGYIIAILIFGIPVIWANIESHISIHKNHFSYYRKILSKKFGYINIIYDQIQNISEDVWDDGETSEKVWEIQYKSNERTKTFRLAGSEFKDIKKITSIIANSANITITQLS